MPPALASRTQATQHPSAMSSQAQTEHLLSVTLCVGTFSGHPSPVSTQQVSKQLTFCQSVNRENGQRQKTRRQSSNPDPWGHK